MKNVFVGVFAIMVAAISIATVFRIYNVDISEYISSRFEIFKKIALSAREQIANLDGNTLLGAVSGSGSGLQAHFGFDESSGPTVYDLSGNGNDGTITGGGPPPFQKQDRSRFLHALDQIIQNIKQRMKC